MTDKMYVVCVDGNLNDGEWFANLEDAVNRFRERRLGSEGMLLRMLPSPCILEPDQNAEKTRQSRKSRKK